MLIFRKIALFSGVLKRPLPHLDRPVISLQWLSAVPELPVLTQTIQYTASFLSGEYRLRFEIGSYTEFESRLDSSHYRTFDNYFSFFHRKLLGQWNQCRDNSHVCLSWSFLLNATYRLQPLFSLRNFCSLLSNPPQGWAFGQRKSKQDFMNGNLFLTM